MPSYDPYFSSVDISADAVEPARERSISPEPGRASSSPSSLFESTGTTLQNTPIATRDAAVVDHDERGIATRDFAETNTPDRERARLTDRVEEMSPIEIPDDLPTASPSPGHAQRSIRSMSDGSIRYSPPAGQQGERALPTPQRRVSRFRKGEASNEPPEDGDPQPPGGWRWSPPSAETPAIPPRSPLRPPVRPFLSLQDIPFPPPTLTVTSRPAAPDAESSPVSAQLHQDFSLFTAQRSLESNDITPDSLTTPLMMAPVHHNTTNGHPVAGHPGAALAAGDYLQSTDEEPSPSSSDSPLMMAPFVRSDGGSDPRPPIPAGYGRGPSPGQLTARLEDAQRARAASGASSTPSSTCTGHPSPVPAVEAAPASSHDHIDVERIQQLPTLIQTAIAASIADVGRSLRMLDARSNSILRAVYAAFPRWFGTPLPDPIHIRDQRTLGLASPLGNSMPLNTPVNVSGLPRQAERPMSFNTASGNPEDMEISTDTDSLDQRPPHIQPPPSLPPGPLPQPMHFDSTEQRNEWVAELFRSITNSITNELNSLETVLHGLRPLMGLGAPYMGIAIEQVQNTRRLLRRLDDSWWELHRARMGRGLSSLGPEVTELQDRYRAAADRVLAEVMAVQRWDGRDREVGDRERQPEDVHRSESAVRDALKSPLERSLFDARFEHAAGSVRESREDAVPYPDLPELAADESTSLRLRPPPETLPSMTYSSPDVPELVAGGHTQNLHAIPPRDLPQTRYGLQDVPARTDAWDTEFVKVRDPVTGFVRWELHPRYHVADDDATEAQTMPAPWAASPPITRRPSGLPEPAADDVAQHLPEDLFPPSTPTTRRLRGVPVKASPVWESEFLDVLDRDTGRETRHYAKDQQLGAEASLTPAPLDPRRVRLERLRTTALSDEQNRRSPAPSPQPPPQPGRRQRSSTASTPVSPYDTRSPVSGFQFTSPSQQARTVVESAGGATRESLRLPLRASTAHSATGTQPSPLTSQRARNENETPVSPSSRGPLSTSIAETLLPGAQPLYPDLSNLQRSQGPVEDSRPLERLGSQDITAAQRDSLRGSAIELPMHRGRRRSRVIGDEGDQARDGGSPPKKMASVEERVPEEEALR